MKQHVWVSGRRTRRGSERGAAAWQRVLVLLLAVFTVAALAPASTALADEASDGKWKRLAGNGRYDTMAAIVSEGFESSEWAIIATGKSFPDALVAAPVAGALDAPIILTKPNELSKQASDMIDKLGVKYAFIMGGESAVSMKVQEQLQAKNIAVGRIDGSSRQATSIAAMNKLAELGKLSDEKYVVIATGKSFADALSIGPACYRYHTPILLTKNDGTLTKDQIDACKRLGITSAMVVGGTAVVSDKVWDQLGIDTERYGKTRLAGNNRYQTSLEVARYFQLLGWNAKYVGIATGKDFPDALAGAALCGKNKSYLLLVKDENSATLDLINADSGIETGYVLGGKNAVSEDLYAYLQERVNNHYEIIFQ